jgi:thiamine-phosphate pyrophosphorylase
MISKLHYITQGVEPEDHIKNLQKACAYGVDWVQLRIKNSDPKQILETAKKARIITARFKSKLIINDYYKIAKEVKADGVHLGTTDACPVVVRNYLGKSFIIGGTANTLEDCRSLLAKKVDYIGLGPYKFTKTKMGLSPILGLASYKNLLEKLQTETPIIAIGGITLDKVSDIMKTGIYGVAVSEAITKNITSIPMFYKVLMTQNSPEHLIKIDHK